MFSTVFIFGGIELPLGVIIYAYESCNDDGGSLVPQVNVCGSGTGGS